MSRFKPLPGYPWPLRLQFRYLLVDLSRATGALVCRHKGHCFSYEVTGVYESWCAYSCIRCGLLDRSLDDLPPAPDDIYDYCEEQYRVDQIEAAKRWWSRFPWPHWL